MRKDLVGALAQKKSTFVQKASESSSRGDLAEKADSEMRIRFLVRLRARAEQNPPILPSQSVFISYSQRTGAKYYELAKNIALSQGFEVITGFQHPESQDKVLRTVMDSVNRSTVFLSIMTPEYSIRPLESEDKPRTAPSVWLMEEKGMALILEKPFRLLVEESVHHHFWKRTTPDKLCTIFDPINFSEKATEALQALHNRYDELLLRIMS